MMQDEIRIGSLFSGIGGIELGFKRAGGYRTVWFIENEPYAKRVLKKNFKKAKIYDDITRIDFRKLQKVDVITGGFPCQDISNAGKRTGIKGSRSSLWKYYLKAIRILRPRYALIENVSALTRRGLHVVLRDLASIGYDAEWHCVSASSVGAPHQRDRIFIIAYCDVGQREQQDEKIQSRRNTIDYESVEFSYSNSSRYVHRESEELSNNGGKQTLSLSKAVRMTKMFPTPTSQDNRGKGKFKFDSQNFPDAEKKGTGTLNPDWVEWLMGFPTGWTELSASETPSSHKLRKSLRKQSKKKSG